MNETICCAFTRFYGSSLEKFHEEVFGGIDAYYTPFVRIERGGFRNRDVRDIAPENNTVSHVVPQLIASTPVELERLAALFTEKGYKEADFNMGCPFPLVARKHKGSGILPYPAEVEALLKELTHYPELSFSVKMRLGWESADEWRPLLPLLNAAPLRRIVLHPRIGKQQYKGEVDLAAFTAFYEECAHPLVYNGDLLTVEDIRKVEEKFSCLEGVMLGRGLLANPALAWEYVNGTSFSPDKLHEKVKALHARLLQYYEAHLQGEAQLLSKMKPYWEYLLPDADRKIKKAIKKATTMDKYLTAVNSCNDGKGASIHENRSASSVHSAGLTACKIGKYPDRRTFSFLSVTSSPYFCSYLLDKRCVRHACILRNTYLSFLGAYLLSSLLCIQLLPDKFIISLK